jgi:hypothetical protein
MSIKGLKPGLSPYSNYRLLQEQDDRNELVRLLVQAEADPTFIPTGRKGSQSPLALSLDDLESSEREKEHQVFLSIMKFSRLSSRFSHQGV